MSPLERRYRRMLRLLPADHRAARGEELLGLLLDLDEGRDRPSPRQAVGVLGLVLRLRLLPVASLLTAAFLIADGTSIARIVYPIATGTVNVTVADSFPIHNVAVVLLIDALLRLGTAVASILGARRAALAAFAALMALQMQPSIPDGLGLHNLGILVVLTAAALWRWPAPRPRAALLAATAVALLLWTLIAIRSPHGVSHVTAQPHPTLAWMVGGAVVGALVAGVFARRRQRLTIMTMMVVGMCGGLALPTAAPWLSYHSTNGWLLCVTASIALLGVAGGPPPNRQAHSGNQLDGHARGPATGSAWLSAYECRK